MRFIKHLLLLVLLLALPIHLHAALSVSDNTPAHGQSVTVTGSGFGSKSSAAPLLWDDFEDGTVGASVGTSGKVSWGTDGTAPEFSTTNNRGGVSTKNARAVLAGSNVDGNYHDMFYKDGLDLSGKAYIGFWAYFNSYAPGNQVKYWRIGSGGTGGYPTYSYFRTDGWGRYQYTYPSGSDCGSAGGGSWYDGVEDNIFGEWIFVELIADFGSVGSSNGSIHVFVNGVDQGGEDNYQLLTSSSCLPSSVRFGEYLQDADGTTTNYFDDIYVDNTWARVVIGNASTYASSTQREVQRVSSWGDTAIAFTVNQGGFDPGETAYIYVIDESNNVVDSGQITFASASSDPNISSASDTTPAMLQSVTITGQNFGSHSLNVESLIENFENGTEGAKFSASNWQIVPFPDNFWPMYDDSRAYSGSQSLINDRPYFGDSRAGINYDYGSTIPDGSWVYVSFMGRIEDTGDVGQWKIFRLNGTVGPGSVDDQFPETFLSSWMPSSPSDSLWLIRRTSTTDITYRRYPSLMPVSGDGWRRIEMLYKLSSGTSQADGDAYLWVHNPGTSITLDETYSNISFFENSDRYRSFVFSHYMGNQMSGNQKSWLDDIYIQVGNRARIEIGNNSVWENCTRREIQVPTSWSDTSATFQVNQGGFNDGETAYVFLVDDNGIASSGFPITFSGEAPADTTPPSVANSSVDSAGTQLTLTFNESVVFGAGGTGGLTLTASGGTANLSSISAAGNLVTADISRTIQSDETLSVDYTQPGDGLQDSAGNDVVSFSGQAVTNGSGVGTDVTAPVLQSVSPPDGSSGQDKSTVITWTYNENLSAVNLTVESVAYTCVDSELDCSNAVVAFTPQSDWPQGTTVNWSIQVTDGPGNQQGAPDTGSFDVFDYPDGTWVTDVEDTFINSGESTTNYSTDQFLRTYVWPENTAANISLLKFDLANIDHPITSAQVCLNVTSVNGTNPLPIAARKITGNDPVIASVNWSAYDGTNTWTGGDVLNDLAPPESVVNVEGIGQYCWDVSVMAEEWRTGTNYGVAFVPGNGVVDSWRYFTSREVTEKTSPVLIVSTPSAPPASIQHASGAFQWK